MTNPSHPRVHNPNGSKNWRDWLPKPAPPKTKRELQKKLSDLAVQNVDVRSRIAATRNHQTVEQYRMQTRRDAALRKIGTLLEVTASPRSKSPRSKSRGPSESVVASRYGLSVSEWRRATRR